jgi:hypothetical protein
VSERSSKSFLIGALPLRLPEDQYEIQFQINDPGVVRSVAYCLEQRLVVARGQAQFDEVLTLFVETTPNGTKRNRRFVVVPTGKQLGAPDGYALTFLGTAVSGNTGQVAHVYEIKAVS